MDVRGRQPGSVESLPLIVGLFQGHSGLIGFQGALLHF